MNNTATAPTLESLTEDVRLYLEEIEEQQSMFTRYHYRMDKLPNGSIAADHASSKFAGAFALLRWALLDMENNAAEAFAQIAAIVQGVDERNKQAAAHGSAADLDDAAVLGNLEDLVSIYSEYAK